MEVLFPVEDPELRDALVNDVLFFQVRDEALAQELQSEGGYKRVARSNGAEPLNSQDYLTRHGGA